MTAFSANFETFLDSLIDEVAAQAHESGREEMRNIAADYIEESLPDFEPSHDNSREANERLSSAHAFLQSLADDIRNQQIIPSDEKSAFTHTPLEQ